MYDALLEDLVYPVEIVGKRIRIKLDGTQLIKVHLDKNEQTNIEHKVNTSLMINVPVMYRILYFIFICASHKYKLLIFVFSNGN